MTTQEHLLTILGEECVETAQRASKALRFGLEEIEPGYTLANAERIMVEYDDIVAMVLMLQERGLLPESKMSRVKAKQEKVLKFLEYSRACGTLKDNA